MMCRKQARIDLALRSVGVLFACLVLLQTVLGVVLVVNASAQDAEGTVCGTGAGGGAPAASLPAIAVMVGVILVIGVLMSRRRSVRAAICLLVLAQLFSISQSVRPVQAADPVGPCCIITLAFEGISVINQN